MPTIHKVRPSPSYFGFLTASQRCAIRKAVSEVRLDYDEEVNRQAARYGVLRCHILRSLLYVDQLI